MDIEEVIKRIEELRDSYELHQRSWATRCLEIIENYVKNSVSKNKIKEKIEHLREKQKYCSTEEFREYYNQIEAYKELLENK